MKALVFGLLFAFVHSINAVDIDTALETHDIDRPVKTAVPATTFKLKYYTSSKFATNGDTSPLLVHITYNGDAKKLVTDGPESFIFAVAQQLSATLAVFEHRFFANSRVDNADPANWKDAEDIKADVAIADFNAILDVIRKSNDRKVILSGVGYAGELATIMRIKQTAEKPFFASIISNAPLLLHQDGGVDLGEFDNKLTSIYEADGCTFSKIQTAIKVIIDLKAADKAIALDIVTALKLSAVESDKILEDGEKAKVLDYIHDALIGLARENLENKHDLSDGRSFDRRPVKAYCDAVNLLTAESTTAEKIEPLRLLIETYYQKVDLDGDSHSYADSRDSIQTALIKCFTSQSYHCTLGEPNDHFSKICENPTDKTKWLNTLKIECKAKLKLDNAATATITGDAMKTLTDSFKYTDVEKVIYIDGTSDPNKVGSINAVDNNKKQYQLIIPKATQGAHTLKPTSCDPDNVKEARYRTINLLNCWLADDTTNDKCKDTTINADLPEYASIEDSTCEDQLSGFPWGRDGSDPPPTGTSSKPPTAPTSKTSSAPSHLLVQIPLIAFISLILLR